MRLSKKDREVIREFTSGFPMTGDKLSSVERLSTMVLDGHWMGGSLIAWWGTSDAGDRKIYIDDLGSKAAESVQKIIKRETPKNYFGGYGVRSSR
jgi:hypothetical protein